MLRILAGQYKGQAIQTVSTAPYRPTQSRIRKSLFDTLGDITGRNFLDAYAGSGIIGFEACSRGVRQLVSIEKHPKVISLLKKNSIKFKNSDIKIIKNDVMKVLPINNTFDIIFSDPPYQILEDTEYTKSLIQKCIDSLSNDGIYVLEIAKELAQFQAERRKDFGDTTLLFWRNQS